MTNDEKKRFDVELARTLPGADPKLARLGAFTRALYPETPTPAPRGHKNEQRYRASKEAIALRAAAKEFWAPREEDRSDPDDKAGHARWRALSSAAVAYARLLLAGQCIPKE